jgi:hypothetical protein
VNRLRGQLSWALVLRPQGVGSGGFDSLGWCWFWIVLLVIARFVIHVVVSSLASEATKEVHMENANQNQNTALKVTKLSLVSLIDTMWAIGTSAAAGALST